MADAAQNVNDNKENKQCTTITLYSVKRQFLSAATSVASIPSMVGNVAGALVGNVLKYIRSCKKEKNMCMVLAAKTLSARALQQLIIGIENKFVMWEVVKIVKPYMVEHQTGNIPDIKKVFGFTIKEDMTLSDSSIQKEKKKSQQDQNLKCVYYKAIVQRINGKYNFGIAVCEAEMIRGWLTYKLTSQDEDDSIFLDFKATVNNRLVRGLCNCLPGVCKLVQIVDRNEAENYLRDT